MQKTLWIYGYDLGNGKFNEVGAAWTYEDAKNAVKEIGDDEMVIRSKKIWWVPPEYINKRRRRSR